MEKSDLPTGGQPCQLAKSVKELWEKMSCYLSFSDKEVFKGITPLEVMLTTVAKEAKPHILMAISTTTSKEQAAKETQQKLVKERKCPKFPRWKKSAAPILAHGGCRAAPSPIKKHRADFSTCG